jgi:hypothetical protein
MDSLALLTGTAINPGGKMITQKITTANSGLENIVAGRKMEVQSTICKARRWFGTDGNCPVTL